MSFVKVRSGLNQRDFTAHFEYDGFDLHLFEIQWADTREAMPEEDAQLVLGHDCIELLYQMGYEQVQKGAA